MSLTLNNMRYAVAVADTLSFTRAAEVCKMTKAAIFNGITSLEGFLGYPVFERHSSGKGYEIRVTEQGTAFLKHAAACLAHSDQIKRTRVR